MADRRALRRRLVIVLYVVCLECGRAWNATAQSRPNEPLSFASGAVTLGGDVLATFAPSDTGQFNDTSYGRSALNALQLDLAGTVRLGARYSLLGELRTQNLASMDVLALYLRIRPSLRRRFDIQAGRIPPTFGAYGRRAYADNLLIGHPLAYQYLTSLRADAIPADVDELVRMRGRGAAPVYSAGDDDARPGVPLVAGAFHWDTGVQAHVATDRVNATAAVTTGTISNPWLYDRNTRPQVIGRTAVRPLFGLTIGASVARGSFVTDSVRSLSEVIASRQSFTQTAWGGDVEYARNHLIVRSELVSSRWTVPLLAATVTPLGLTATSIMVESRYRVAPGIDVAGRVDHLGFSDVWSGSFGGPWDAPISRVEVGCTYAVRHNLLLKVSYQRNWRSGVAPHDANVIATQLVAHF